MGSPVQKQKLKQCKFLMIKSNKTSLEVEDNHQINNDVAEKYRIDRVVPMRHYLLYEYMTLAWVPIKVQEFTLNWSWVNT